MSKLNEGMEIQLRTTTHLLDEQNIAIETTEQKYEDELENAL